MKTRQLIASASVYEPVVGFSRAVRAGNVVAVAGTVAEGADAYEQAKAAILKIDAALHEAGATLADVVRTRLFVTDIEAQWEQVGRAHSEAFGSIMPVTSMLEISRLIDPRYLIEIEADAIVAIDAPGKIG
jgi:enamine deaminase RidA (YjgF/YER057c/UK114 family)